MRFAPLTALLGVLVLAGSASAGTALPVNGFVVYKDLRSYGVKEVRDKATGRVVSKVVSFGDKTAPGTECGDSRHRLAGVYWQPFERYMVNVGSTPSHIGASAALADINASARAWETPFTTDCSGVSASSRYDAVYGGTTTRLASLAASLTTDGVNAVAFQSLAGTVCDGALACVVIDYKGSKIVEADLAFERDLTRYGFEDYWTTDETTWFDKVGGRLAISDTATHEFGHFAGLDHVEKSPALTMFPAIHNGSQSLGLGDMKGLLARYSRGARARRPIQSPQSKSRDRPQKLSSSAGASASSAGSSGWGQASTVAFRSGSLPSSVSSIRACSSVLNRGWFSNGSSTR